MLEFFVIEYMTVLGMTMLLLFLDSRYPKRWTILAVYSTMLLVMAIIFVVYQVTGLETTIQIYTFITHIPSLLLLMVFSRFRGWRMVFQLLSVVLFCFFIQHGAGLAYYLSNNIWILILSYTILTLGVIIFLIRFLRPLFLRALLTLKRGWWLMCLVIVLYYIIIIYLIPGYVGITLNTTLLKLAISLLMVGFYSILMFLFSNTLKESEARHEVQLSALQLSALKSRMETVKATEDIIRMDRHDLRHRLQVVTELVSRGDTETALDFLDAAQKRLDEQKEVHWCRPPILDAVFSSYFDQAQRKNIQVKAKISLPDTLPIDEGELAIVLANALDNAIQANIQLPYKQREICCKMVATPSVMLELSNPFDGKVTFDDQGLPATQKEGHGLGVQSISAFCRKSGAVCQFEVVDGWFRLRLVL